MAGVAGHGAVQCGRDGMLPDRKQPVAGEAEVIVGLETDNREETQPPQRGFIFGRKLAACEMSAGQSGLRFSPAGHRGASYAMLLKCKTTFQRNAPPQGVLAEFLQKTEPDWQLSLRLHRFHDLLQGRRCASNAWHVRQSAKGPTSRHGCLPNSDRAK